MKVYLFGLFGFGFPFWDMDSLPGGRPPTAVVEAAKAALVSHGVFTVEGAAKRAFVEFRGACEDDWLQADTCKIM